MAGVPRVIVRHWRHTGLSESARAAVDAFSCRRPGSDAIAQQPCDSLESTPSSPLGRRVATSSRTPRDVSYHEQPRTETPVRRPKLRHRGPLDFAASATPGYAVRGGV